jgi:hypothetical protein
MYFAALHQRSLGMIDAVNMLISSINDLTQVIPGHGPVCHKKDLIAYRDMLTTMESRIRTGIANKLSVQEIETQNPLRGLDVRMTTYFVTKQIYDMVMKRMKN